MSFFEDGDEPPTRAQPRPRPRRPTPAGTRPGGGGGAPPADELMRRRLVAAGILFVLVILLFLGLKSCASSRKENALKDYNRDVTQVASDSVENVMHPFFALLNQAPTSASDLQSRINQLRLTSEEQVKTVDGLDVPGDMRRAHDALELTLNLRTTALGRIAALVPDALSDNGQTAESGITRIAGQMQQFLASDVIYSQRVQPYIKAALDDAGISGQRIVGSRSLPDLGWLDKNTIGEALNAKRAAGGTGGNAQPAPGSHGHGLTSVAVGQTTLSPDGTNRLPAGGNPTFNVQFQNQGENDESDVTVRVTVKPSAGKAIVVNKRVDQTTAGEPVEVNIPLGQSPPIGTPATITVEVLKVPGEKNTDNNKQTYTAIFER